jgi:Icc-related predicted phosphoesterase
VLALCGDLTNFGKTSEAEILAEDLRACTIPVVAVLGNHDSNAASRRKVVAILHRRRRDVLDEQATVIEGRRLCGREGLHRRLRPRRARRVRRGAIKTFVDESINEARKLENQLRTLRTERVMAVLHYAPIAETVEGEPLEIFPFLGSSRLANAVDRFDNVKAVVHGHAHRGAYPGDAARRAGLQLSRSSWCSRNSAAPTRCSKSSAGGRRLRHGRRRPARGERRLRGRGMRGSSKAAVSIASSAWRARRSAAPCAIQSRAILAAGQAQHFLQRHFDLPRLEPRVARCSRSRGSVDGVPSRRTTTRSESSVEIACHQALVRRAAGQPRADLLELDLKLLQRDRLLREGDDGADRLRLRLAEALAQQAFEIAERDAAIERAPGGKGDQQALGAVGIADRGLRVGAELAQPLLEQGTAPPRPSAAAPTPSPRCPAGTRRPPISNGSSHGRPPRERSRPRGIGAPAAAAAAGAGSLLIVSASSSAAASNASSRGSSATPTPAHPGPAAAAAASLIAAIRVCARKSPIRSDKQSGCAANAAARSRRHGSRPPPHRTAARPHRKSRPAPTQSRRRRRAAPSCLAPGRVEGALDAVPRHHLDDRSAVGRPRLHVAKPASAAASAVASPTA